MSYRYDALGRCTGETVSYRYDALGRLSNASATASSVGAAWAVSFGYDGFGNRYSQNMTAGTGPSVNIGFDAGNHINYPAGYSYDGNGNLTSVPGASGPVQYDYDYDNRLKGYTYGIDGKRLVKVTPFESSRPGPKVRLEVYFDGPGGQIQGIYDHNPYRTYSSDGYPRDWAFSVSRKESRVYFAGRWVGSVDVNSRLIYRVAEDRLGSVRASATFNSNTGNLQSGFSGYFPYGEQRYGGGANFATYTRDGDTGLDYAQQRQYGSAQGVFTTADPYVASGGPGDPGDWNRYAYVGGDPVNGIDPHGLFIKKEVEAEPCGWWNDWCTPPPILWPGPPPPGPDPDGGTQSPGGPGSDKNWAKAEEKLSNGNDLLHKVLLGKSLSEACKEDLSALGHTANEIANAVDNATWNNGYAAAVSEGGLYTQGFDARAYDYYAVQHPELTIMKHFQQSGKSLGAISALPGSVLQGNIYFNPVFVNGLSTGQSAALLFHEVLHNLGILDSGAQAMLGLSTTAASNNISVKIGAHCFGVKP